MVDVLIETKEQTEKRLKKIIKSARLEVFEQRYCFTEFADTEFPSAILPTSLAIVRDGLEWSQLVPYAGGDDESFGIFSFHFPNGLDNSGFVGWLATHLKERFGTGVFVVCGYNKRDGGVFDYWGCPATVAEAVFTEVRSLVG